MLGDGQGKRPWVYYAQSTGRFHTLHRYSGAVLIAILLVLPWIHIGGAPLLRFDLPGRRLFLMTAVFTPYDTRFLLLLLIFSAIGLGLVTAMAGRVWCGYFCPQTVFLEEVYRRIEVWIEGDRGPRRKLDESPWTPEKIRKKAAKWTIYAFVSVVLGFTLMSYFVDARELWTFQSSSTTYLLTAAAIAGLYANFAWFREQFCNYLCPYARFQGALTDVHSLVIGYDPRRGEPRLQKGVTKKKEVIERGGCIDCNRCVTVCPQGIDIRNGFQLECIACGHCVDACTDVMSKLGHPTLVQYTTEAELKGEPKPKFRFRPVFYGAIMTACVVAGIALILSRTTVDAKVNRASGSYATTTADGHIQNVFVANLFNNDVEDRTFTITTQGLDGAESVVAGRTTIAPSEQSSVSVIVTVDPEVLSSRHTPFSVVITADDETVLQRDAIFISNTGGSP